MPADDFSLSGKVALVTGSGRANGIGASIARALARNGAAVAIHYTSEGSKSRAQQVAADISKETGARTTIVRGDIQEPDAAPRMVKETLEGLGAKHIDILVNNAGVGDTRSVINATPDQLAQEFGVNVFGSIYLTQAVVSVGKMPKGGRIINIGTEFSKRGPTAAAIYAATKAAQDSLTTSWAGELGRSHGITVNSLAPGPVATDMSKAMLENPDGSPSDAQIGMRPLIRAADRIGTTEDIADAVLLIASEKSRWITAQWISVSGGITGTM